MLSISDTVLVNVVPVAKIECAFNIRTAFNAGVAVPPPPPPVAPHGKHNVSEE